MVDLILSVEDTNRIRVRVGLKPIPLPGEVNADPKPPERKFSADLEKLNSRIKDVKERAFNRNAVSTSGSERGGESTATWLSRLKKGLKKSNETAQSQASDIPPDTPDSQAFEPTVAEEVNITDIGVSEPTIESFEESNSTVLAHNDISSHTSFEPLDEDNTIIEASGPVKTDFDTSKPIKFKPRKVKKDKRRNKTTGDGIKRMDPVIIEQIEEDDDKIERIVAAQRVARQRQIRPESVIETLDTLYSDNMAVAEPKEQSKSNKGLVVGETEQFLDSIRRKISTHYSIDAEPVDTSAESSALPPDEDTMNTERNPEPVSELESEDEVESESVRDNKAQLLSVTDTLKSIKNNAMWNRKPKADTTRKLNREWARKLAEKRLARQTDIEHQAATLKDLPQAEREQLMELHAQQAVREDADAAQAEFSEFQPDVRLIYRDDGGNVLDTKEAFKELSRKFHGNKEGKKRLQRRLRKVH